jgi:hypothetical protein
MLFLTCCRLRKVADTGSVVLLHSEATKLTMDVIVKVGSSIRIVRASLHAKDCNVAVVVCKPYARSHCSGMPQLLNGDRWLYNRVAQSSVAKNPNSCFYTTAELLHVLYARPHTHWLPF